MFLDVYFHLQTPIFSFEILAEKGLPNLCFACSTNLFLLSWADIYSGARIICLFHLAKCVYPNIVKHFDFWIPDASTDENVQTWNGQSEKFASILLETPDMCQNINFKHCLCLFITDTPQFLVYEEQAVSNILWVNTNRDSILENLNVSSIVYYRQFKMLKSGKNGHQPRSRR